MNHIEEIFARSNIETISDFLLHGGESFIKNDMGYYERAKEAEKKLNDWLNSQFPEFDEHEKHCGLIYSVIGEVQSVYMQIGIRVGIMLTTEFYAKK